MTPKLVRVHRKTYGLGTAGGNAPPAHTPTASTSSNSHPSTPPEAHLPDLVDPHFEEELDVDPDVDPEVPAIPPPIHDPQQPLPRPPLAPERIERRAVPQDTVWRVATFPDNPALNPPSNFRAPSAPLAYVLGEPSFVRIAYLQAVYHNVFRNMPVPDANDNLCSTLNALDAAGALVGHPRPVRTLVSAKRHLGLDPSEWITEYAICSGCWKHHSPEQLMGLLSPECAVPGCTGLVYKEEPEHNGGMKRIPFNILPHVSLLHRLRAIVRRKGFRKLIRDSRNRPVQQNNDDNFVMTDMYDADIWHELQTGIQREVGNLGSIRDAPINDSEGRLADCRFGLHLSVNLDWFGALSGRPHSAGPVYISINDLPREQRYLQVNVICPLITLGPVEPTTEQLNNCLEPVARDVCELKRGVTMEMYDDDDTMIVEEVVKADVVCTNCDTPAARKVSGTAGHSADIHPCPWCHCVLLDVNRPAGYREEGFIYRDDYDMLKQKFYSRDARAPRQHTILTMHGVRWAIFDAIPGWRPSRQTALDFMHCIYLGVVAFFFTRVLFAAHMLPGAGGRRSPKQRFEDIINSIRWPSHVTRLPKNLGENQSLKKADEWRRLLTVAPVILWYSWKDDRDDIPDTEPPVSANEVITTTHSRRRKSLYDTMLLLCAGVRLLSTKRISMAQAKAGQVYLSTYCQRLLLLGVTLTINHHLAMHFARMIKIFGPVYAWWLFAFERFNGMLEKVNLNGHDGGRMELTMLRNWTQAHLIYELLLELPADCSPHERSLLDNIIGTEARQARGGMMTEILVMQAEASVDRVALPKRVGQPVNLYHIRLRHPSPADLYSLLLQHCQILWPELALRREFSMAEGTVFRHNEVARRLSYICKDGLRYGCTANQQTQSDVFAFVLRGGLRVPVEIEYLFRVEMPDSGKPPSVCAVVRRLRRDNNIPVMPWDLHASLLGIQVTYADQFHEYEVIPATDIDCPLALIPVHAERTMQDLWISVSFDHVRADSFNISAVYSNIHRSA
ncbi:hypothetical protein FA95DRAFT_1497378 [Auriscalpium vulgare]|uniref:Uncharacterized protein n=1 Tax=Auriscalpium vulgare TaxID=40419 RepID=A0ACB8RKJ5_9AGAM|nr:hypothetical protein FA95DRAFT_1497378 [Auriscalpium vulgare]